MKKKFALLLTVVFLLILCASCASGFAKSETDSSYGSSYSNGQSGEAPAADEDTSGGDDSGDLNRDTGLDTIDTQSGSLADKIIYTAYAEVETVEFDETLDRVDQMLEQYGAFLESSSVTGASYEDSYYGNQTYRRATFVIRVPKENYEAMTNDLSVLGNVVSSTSSGQNITSQFTDTESRLATYEIEEERLLAMLEQAENVEDMITIESRLSEVRYEIESLTTTLRNWQNQVDYSTVTLTISEVAELTDIVPAQRTYLEEIGDGLKSTFKAIASFFKWLLKTLIVLLPVLVILAVIALIVIFSVRCSSRRRKKKMQAADKPAENK